MISVEEALKLVREHMPIKKGITEDILSDREYPPFNRVMMDGIAVAWNVFSEGKREFKIAGICPAGEPERKLEDLSQCFEVMTGAPLPENTDLVIPYEHIKIENGVAVVTNDVQRTHLENVHLKGSDTKKDQVVLSRGSLMNGPHWGIAASMGVSHVNHFENIRINIVSTGDELVDIDETPARHQIRRSNVYALEESLNLFGFHNIELSHLADDQETIQNHYEKASKEFDLLIYSGGVSKGKFDYLPETWKKSGVKEIFHGISQRPGKPLWFGYDEKSQTHVLGLPGNPVSSLVCLHKYLLSDREIFASLTEEIVFKKDLTFFVPVKLKFGRDGKLHAEPLGIKNSGEFTALAGSDGFIELPKEKSIFEKGQAFQFHPWRPM